MTQSTLRPAVDVIPTGAGEPAVGSPVAASVVEEIMADDTPWARFYRQQASGGASPAVGRLLDSWKTRKTLGERGTAQGEARDDRG